MRWLLEIFNSIKGLASGETEWVSVAVITRCAAPSSFKQPEKGTPPQELAFGLNGGEASGEFGQNNDLWLFLTVPFAVMGSVPW